MFRVNKDGVLEDVFPVEDLCDHCKNEKACDFLLVRDAPGYDVIGSSGQEDDYTYIVGCNKFESHDGIYRVRVEVEETGVILE